MLGLDPVLLGQRQSITAGQDQGQPGNFYPYLNNPYGPTYSRAQETFIQHPQSSSPAFVRQQQQERTSRPLVSPAFEPPMNANQPKHMPIVVSGSPRLPQHSQPPPNGYEPRESSCPYPKFIITIITALPTSPDDDEASRSSYPCSFEPTAAANTVPPTLSDGHNANGFSLSATISRATTASPSDYTPAKTSCARRLWFFNFSAGTAITAHCTYKSIGISYTGRYSSTAAAFAS